MINKILISIFFSSLFISCKSGSNNEIANSGNNIFKYAQNISHIKGSNEIIIRFNWDGKNDSITYIMVPNDSKEKSIPNKKIFYIKTPINSVAALSTTHIAMINEINEIETISGTCDYFRMSNKRLWEKYKSGELTDLGTSMDVNQEKLIDLECDAVFKTAFSSANFKKDEIFHSIGIPIIYTYSWHEKSPLARAEWIKLFGLLYNESEKADSVFNDIETKYIAIANKAKSIAAKPKVLAGDLIKDTWHMPGGDSYVAKFIEDAGGDFVYAQSEGTGSIPLNFENVIEMSEQVDVWIGAKALTYKELFESDSRYKLLQVCTNKNAYNKNKQDNGTGGNNIWEEGYIRPDIILADLFSIIHPEEVPNYELQFYKKIE